MAPVEPKSAERIPAVNIQTPVDCGVSRSPLLAVEWAEELVRIPCASQTTVLATDDPNVRVVSRNTYARCGGTITGRTANVDAPVTDNVATVELDEFSRAVPLRSPSSIALISSCAVLMCEAWMTSPEFFVVKTVT